MTAARTAIVGGRALVLALVLAVGACAAPSYGRAGNAADVGAALARARPGENRPVNATGRPLVFLAFGGTSAPRLAAYDLAQAKLLWTQSAELIGRVEVGRDAIVHAARGQGARTELVGRALGSGAPLWRHGIGADERLIGYALDGDAAFYVVRAGDGTRHGRGTAVALDALTGAVRWRHDLPSGDVGGPAARGGLVAVPVQSQYVSLLDGASGADAAQILSTEDAATFVRAVPEGFVFGSKGVFFASAATATASRQSPGYARATLPKFVRPFYYHDMYRPEQIDYSAIDSNRVLWRIVLHGAGAGEGAASFKDGMVFIHNFRFFFGLDARSGAVRWAYSQPEVDAVSSDDTGGALLFATTDGQIAALDTQTGVRGYVARVPGVTMVRGATFDAGGFTLPHGSNGNGNGDGAGEAAPLRSDGLARALSAIAWDPDRRFSDVKVFAVDELGKMPGRAITADLVKLTQKQDMPPALRQSAGEALIARQDGNSIDLFIETLKIHADYIEDKHPGGVDIIARAAGAMKARAVAQALAEHLRLPETEPEAVTHISQALIAMEATEALPALRDYLSMYRADAAFDIQPAPVLAVADALLRLGGAGERQLLLFFLEEPQTIEPLRLHIQRALAQTAMTAR